jgi:hypothetical protein
MGVDLKPSFIFCISSDPLQYADNLQRTMSHVGNVSYSGPLKVPTRGNCHVSDSLHVKLIPFQIITYIFFVEEIAHCSSVLVKVEPNTLKRMRGKPRCLLLYSRSLPSHFLNCFLGLFTAPKWYFLAS